jgi:hypothetical protein
VAVCRDPGACCFRPCCCCLQRRSNADAVCSPFCCRRWR